MQTLGCGVGELPTVGAGEGQVLPPPRLRPTPLVQHWAVLVPPVLLQSLQGLVGTITLGAGEVQFLHRPGDPTHTLPGGDTAPCSSLLDFYCPG